MNLFPQAPFGLLVLGATGGTGRRVVEAALARRWTATAWVRRADAFPERPAGLRVVSGDVTDRAALAAALPGHDVVVAALGQRWGSPPDLLRRAMDATVGAMHDAGVRRLVAVSGAAVKFAGDAPPPALERVAVPMIRCVLPHLLDDTRGYADRVAESGLDWVLARPTKLTDGAGGARVIAADTLSYAPWAWIARADLARFLLDAAVDDAWLRRTPMLTTGGDRSPLPPPVVR